MFALAIVHLGIDAFIVATGIMTGADLRGVIGTISALDGLQHFGKARFAIIVLQTMIADGFMVYRAFIVWNSSWCVISAPFAIFVCSVGLGVTTTFHPSLSAVNLKALIGTRVYFLLTVATNVISLIMIMKPLLGSRSAMGEYRPKGSQLRTVRWRVMESILQSAAIFLVSSLVYTVMTFVSPLGFGFWHYISHPIVGIAFTLTVARICLSPAESRPSAHGELPINLGAYPYPHGAPLSRTHSHSHSCPSLPATAHGIETYGEDDEADVEGKSTCSNAETGGALGMMIGRPIAIHVSVSTTRRSDRDAGDLESEIAGTEGSRAGGEHGSVREDEFGTKMYLISSPDEK
ncbi:hypothetical protein C8Q74DRAFT_1373666 [Fomes fomentarius]|nr:hypothetical protein C8Q74DRAFT_1373666 [Fomes fomentarius]